MKELRSLGLSPDMIICRSAEKLEPSTCHKIALFCHVPPENVLSVHDVSNVYHVPLMLRDQNIVSVLSAHLCFPRFLGKVATTFIHTIVCVLPTARWEFAPLIVPHDANQA